MAEKQETLDETIITILSAHTRTRIFRIDEPELLKEDEVQEIVLQTFKDLAIVDRVRIHAKAWVSDVEEHASQLAKNTINAKIKKATANV